MPIDYSLLSKERCAAIASITAHREALGLEPLDHEDFGELRFALTDALISLRIFAASFELEFDQSLRDSKGAANDAMRGNL